MVSGIFSLFLGHDNKGTLWQGTELRRIRGQLRVKVEPPPQTERRALPRYHKRTGTESRGVPKLRTRGGRKHVMHRTATLSPRHRPRASSNRASKRQRAVPLATRNPKLTKTGDPQLSPPAHRVLSGHSSRPPMRRGPDGFASIGDHRTWYPIALQTIYN